jgi:hypothetical protein
MIFGCIFINYDGFDLLLMMDVFKFVEDKGSKTQVRYRLKACIPMCVRVSILKKLGKGMSSLFISI